MMTFEIGRSDLKKKKKVEISITQEKLDTSNSSYVNSPNLTSVFFTYLHLTLQIHLDN